MVSLPVSFSTTKSSISTNTGLGGSGTNGNTSPHPYATSARVDECQLNGCCFNGPSTPTSPPSHPSPSSSISVPRSSVTTTDTVPLTLKASSPRRHEGDESTLSRLQGSNRNASTESRIGLSATYSTPRLHRNGTPVAPVRGSVGPSHGSLRRAALPLGSRRAFPQATNSSCSLLEASFDAMDCWRDGPRTDRPAEEPPREPHRLSVTRDSNMEPAQTWSARRWKSRCNS